MSRPALRRELIQRRLAIADTTRMAWDAAIGERLRALLDGAGVGVLAFCWPHRGEYDARALMAALVAQGQVVALPVVQARHQPLWFRRWTPASTMVVGEHGIAEPAGTELVTPATILVPVVGFDERGYRLGYGGGYFDRTLAPVDRPAAVGVGYELSRVASIQPQPHDRPMDLMVTESGLFGPGPQGWALLTVAQARAVLAGAQRGARPAD